ncbi:DMT family transporter [Vibrio scophthalmi]|uniref:EamA domain-containing protein n=1 Tax=Vibrio scophthalmi TaxID=45658 RepID=A0A1E3WM99_9VIBR|nr:DMT family transporter [Vibrio scophthalmi]ODS10865.1 uncharacterized protein VSF3289_01125 [Vibrio scophthalmi]
MSTLLQTALAMLAFAANSLLCRLALTEGLIDASNFTLIRLISGATTLGLILTLTQYGRTCGPSKHHQDAYSINQTNLRFGLLAGMALFGYALLFSFAYIRLAAGTGALLLFGAVQLTLLLLYRWQGERFKRLECLGITISLVGFVWLMFPSATRPDIASALLMILSGVCWAIFTALGKQAASPAHSITWGFISAAIICVIFSPLLFSTTTLTWMGVLLATVSGVLASALGYLLWYQVMQKLSLLQAAVSQLSVPVIALLLGASVLHEPLTLHNLITSIIILGGIALVFIASKSTS